MVTPGSSLAARPEFFLLAATGLLTSALMLSLSLTLPVSSSLDLVE